MRILIDENLPDDLIGVLRALGHDVEHVYTTSLGSRPDSVVRKFAAEADRFLVTLDTRFADARTFITGTHPGIALVRIKDADYPRIIQTVREAFATNDVESWRGCIVVISDRPVRVHRE
jgi:predicted nuclease of predicted toxin-antitoxin system